MSKELIDRLRNAATFGTCLDAADALEEAERKLAIAREAIKYGINHRAPFADIFPLITALAQIGDFE